MILTPRFIAALAVSLLASFSTVASAQARQQVQLAQQQPPAVEQMALQPELESQTPKRPSAHLNAVTDDGVPYSASHGQLGMPPLIKWGILAAAGVALLLTYYLIFATPRAKSRREPQINQPAPVDLQAAATAFAAPQIIPAPLQHLQPSSSQSRGDWADLVNACGGDLQKVFIALSSERIVDPHLSPSSDVILQRATRRVTMTSH